MELHRATSLSHCRSSSVRDVSQKDSHLALVSSRPQTWIELVQKSYQFSENELWLCFAGGNHRLIASSSLAPGVSSSYMLLRSHLSRTKTDPRLVPCWYR